MEDNKNVPADGDIETSDNSGEKVLTTIEKV